MNIEMPSYYAVIPSNVRYDKTLRPNEKLLYGEITALSSATGECWASNNYFAELYQVTPQAVSTWINNLKARGYIAVEIVYKNGTKEIEKRVIQIASTNDEGVSIKNEEVSTKVDGGINKSLIGYQQKFKGNNTSKNNTSKNIKTIINTYTDEADLQEALKDFAEMRKRIKKPMTERAWKLVLNKLDSIAPTTEAKIAVLDNAIEHCWQTIYPLKENGLKPQNKAQERLGWIDDI